MGFSKVSSFKGVYAVLTGQSATGFAMDIACAVFSGSECADNWEWFGAMVCNGGQARIYGADHTSFSDRQKGIPFYYEACSVWSQKETVTGWCSEHLKENIYKQPGISADEKNR